MTEPIVLEWIDMGGYGIPRAPASIEQQYQVRAHNLAGALERVVTPDHLCRYAFAASLAVGRRVCDVGCGNGYGTVILAERAALAIGFDRHVPSLHEGRANDTAHASLFIASDFAAPGICAESFDLVAAFEVVEHVADPLAFLCMTLALVRPGGQVVFSTPNRAVISPGWVVPFNPFHMQEWDLAELQAALNTLGVTAAVYGERRLPEDGVDQQMVLADTYTVFASHGYYLSRTALEQSDTFVVVVTR